MSCPIQIISWECVSYFAFIVLVLVGWCKGRLVCTNWVLVRSWWWLDWRFARLEVFVVVDISVISCCRTIRYSAASLPEVVLNVKTGVIIVALLLDCELLSYYVCLWPWVSFQILLLAYFLIAIFCFSCVHQNIMWYVNISSVLKEPVL